LKNRLPLILLAGILCFSPTVSFAREPNSPEAASAYSPNDIKVLGTLASGETSKLVEYTNAPPYRAFVFEGNGRDQVEVTVTGDGGKARVYLADSSLNPIASGIGRLQAALPYRGPDTEAYYILFKDGGNRPARLTVHLKQAAASVQPADVSR
jgi:hypothetical protein